MKTIKEFAIFCDGGFGNRYNALVSGLTIANHFGWNYTIYWPKNNWCHAGFDSIFETPIEAIDKKITELAPDLHLHHALLHDEIAAQTIARPFNDAYNFQNLNSFCQLIENHERVFFYPALIPAWLPQDLVTDTVRRLKVQHAIQSKARQFIEEEFKSSPYYGIHLRRTDLNIGYSDQEVQTICSLHPEKKFFVCSDDPFAEIIAQRLPNVKARRKASYVEKKVPTSIWTSPTADDDGRVYYGNIERSADSVLEALIDMLILGHAEQLGMNGSTFKTVSKMICSASPLLELMDLPKIDYPALSDLKRLNATSDNLFSEKVKWVTYLDNANRSADAIELMRNTLSTLKGRELGLASAKMSELLLKVGAPQESLIYMYAANALFRMKKLLNRTLKFLNHI